MYAAWIIQKIEHFKGEEKTLKRTPNYSHPQQSFERCEGDEPRPWGAYDRKPCYDEPVGDVHIQWIYIVDLDNNSFVVRSGTGWNREFKLENPPRSLFEHDGESEIFIMPISLRYLYGAAPVIGHDLNGLARFTEFAPRKYVVEVPKESHFDAGIILDAWKPLSQLLLQNFLERYLGCFKNLAKAKNTSIFASTGLDGKTATAYQFKQLAYGILNLCDPVGRIKFRPKHRVAHSPVVPSVPPWECPDGNIMWMGNVLIILEARINVEEFLHAAIGKAIDHVRRSHVRIGGIYGTAVIFSIQALVIVNIKYPDDNAGKPSITFSQTLPVITPSECSWTRCFGGLHAQPTEGLAALIDVFARHSESYLLPHGLPVEICDEIYQLCDLETRGALARSCRAFRAILDPYPRIDGWDLIHTWNHGNVGFVARQNGSLEKSVVSLEESKYPGAGCEMGLFRGGHLITLNLPHLEVVEQQNQGFKGCACCVGLPVLTDAPDWPSRSFTIPDHIEQEREESNRLARG